MALTPATPTVPDPYFISSIPRHDYGFPTIREIDLIGPDDNRYAQELVDANHYREYLSQFPLPDEEDFVRFRLGESKFTKREVSVFSAAIGYAIARFKISPIRRLPIELLQMIFAEACTDVSSGNPYPLLHITAVCQFWRAVVLDMPELWCNISLLGATIPQEELHFVSQWIKRSLDLPLTIDIRVSDYSRPKPLGLESTVVRALLFLLKERNRIKSLLLMGNNIIRNMNTACQNLKSNLGHAVAFPRLAELTIHGFTDDIIRYRLSVFSFTEHVCIDRVEKLTVGYHMIFGHAGYRELVRAMPNVKDLKWHCDFKLEVAPTCHFAGLRSLTFEVRQEDEGDSIRALEALILSAPNLVDLSVQCDLKFGEYPWGDDANFSPIKPFNQIQRLSLFMRTRGMEELKNKTTRIGEFIARFPNIVYLGLQVKHDRVPEAFIEEARLAPTLATEFTVNILEVALSFTNITSIKFTDLPLDIHALHRTVKEHSRRAPSTRPKEPLHRRKGRQGDVVYIDAGESCLFAPGDPLVPPGYAGDSLGIINLPNSIRD